MNYVTKHWLGELSLTKSFWVNLLLLSGVVILISFAGIFILHGSTSLRTIIIIYLMITGLLLIPWQLIGTWRSANNYLENGGSKFNGGGAKTVVFIVAVKSFNDYMKVIESIL